MKLTKQLLMASLVATTAATGAFADFTHSPYIGLGIGGVGARHDIRFGENTTGPGAGSAHHDTGSHKQAFAGSIILGWGTTFAKNWHVSAEIDYLLTSLETETAVGVNNLDKTFLRTNIRNKGGFGGALRLGYHLTKEAMVYVRAGFEHRKFNVDFSKKVAPNAPVYNSNFTVSNTAFVPGAGIEVEFAKNWTVGAEFRTTASVKSESVTNAEGGTTDSTQVKPRTYTYLVSVKYKLRDLFN